MGAQVQQAVVGLGNPGGHYRGTRHNMGFQVVNLVADDLGGEWVAAPAFRFSEVVCSSRAVLLVKPTTYMNKCGAAVGAAIRQFGFDLEEVLVVVDDVYLDRGSIRLRRRGSDGGHNGLRSIIESLGSIDFPRLRLGIGMPPDGLDLVDYVLGEVDAGELEVVGKQVRRAANAVACWATLGMDAAMNRYNGT